MNISLNNLSILMVIQLSTSVISYAESNVEMTEELAAQADERGEKLTTFSWNLCNDSFTSLQNLHEEIIGAMREAGITEDTLASDTKEFQVLIDRMAKLNPKR